MPNAVKAMEKHLFFLFPNFSQIAQLFLMYSFSETVLYPPNIVKLLMAFLLIVVNIQLISLMFKISHSYTF